MRGAGLYATAAVRALQGRGGRTVLSELRSAPPLSLRPAAGSLWMVGTAAGPLAGDRVELELDVGPGARLTLRSTAAAVALGGHGRPASELLVDAQVGPGGELRWLPEPTVATAGARHLMAARVRLAGGARLVWREELVLGRHGEAPGTLCSRIHVEREGSPLLRQELRLGPGATAWAGAAVVGGAGATGGVVVVDPAWETEPGPGRSIDPEAAVLTLAPGAALVSAVAPGARELRCRLDRGMAWLAG
ncbi:MAG: urease accessory protein UreD [Actinomycetota bacterium]|nr:urease accessory protein UreD [Actinomycetota bacterium]